MARFEPAVEHTFRREGGYADDPVDKGGATNMGITRATLLAALGFDRDKDGFLDADFDRDGDVDAEDVRLLPREKAEAIYRARYWDGPGFGAILDQRVATKAFDLGVHAGPRVSVRLLQKAVNHLRPRGFAPLLEDGQLGAKTAEAVNACDPEILLSAMVAEQRVFYVRIFERDPTQEKFRRNWLRRAAWPFDDRGIT